MTDNPTSNPQKQHIDDVFSQLSDNQWRLITAMIENPTFTKRDAALHINIKPETVYRWDKIVDVALERARANVHEAALSMRRQAVLKAIAVKLKLLDSEDETVRSKASTEIIEWELGKAISRNEITGKDGSALTIKVVYDDTSSDTDLS